MRYAYVVAIVAVLAVGAAACGSDESDGTGAEGGDFVSGANAICLDAATERIELDQELGAVDQSEEIIELVERVQPIEQEAIERLDALEPTGDAAGPFEESIELRRQADALSEDAIAAAEADDQQQFGEISAQRQELLDKGRDAAADAGLDVCGQVLPGAAEAEVTESVEQAGTAAEGTCEDLYTEAYIEVNYGGDLERCDQEGPGADSVEVTDVRGIEDVQAEALATLEGGRFTGESFEVTLLDVGGSWKIDSINPAS